LCAHILADQGRLDYDARVRDYWPDFAQAGKEDITVSQVLSHQAGLRSVRGRLAPGDVWRVDPVVRALELEVPEWEPGTRFGCHPYTFGHLVGELVRRIDGRDLQTFLREEVTGPLGVAFTYGTGPDQTDDVADVIPSVEAGGGVARDLDQVTSFDDPAMIAP